jgi:hypothetical protein
MNVVDFFCRYITKHLINACLHQGELYSKFCFPESLIFNIRGKTKLTKSFGSRHQVYNISRCILLRIV